MRRSRSWEEALRRAKYRTTANTARLRMSAVAYHTVSRPRMVSTLGPDHVAHAAHRVDQFRLPALIDFFPEPRPHHVHDVRAGVGVIVPGLLGYRRARHGAGLA